MSDYPKCDFCSAAYPAWVHPSADFVVGNWGSADNAWAACETCHELIVAEDKTGLANRALRTVPGGVPRDIRRHVLKKINEMHAGFWANRFGTPHRQSHIRDAQHRQEGLT
jgi:hypothetical protein